MSYEENNNAGKILIGFVIGAAAGAILGVLLAPEKGQITRQSITDASLKFKDGLNGQIQKGVEKFNSLKASATGKADTYKNGKSTPVGEENNSGNF